MKKKDICNSLRKQMGVITDLPSLDKETIWSYKFLVVKDALKLREVINGM